MRVSPWSRAALSSGRRPAGAGIPAAGGAPARLTADTRRFLFFLLLVAAIVAYLSARWDEYAREAARRSPSAEEALLVGPAPAEAGDFFAETRLERERARSAYRQQLRSLATEGTEGERAAARKALVELAWQAMKGTEAEVLVRARGCRDALVLMHQDGSVVIVRAPSLTPADMLTVAEAVGRATGLAPGWVRSCATRASRPCRQGRRPGPCFWAGPGRRRGSGIIAAGCGEPGSPGCRCPPAGCGSEEPLRGESA